MSQSHMSRGVQVTALVAVTGAVAAAVVASLPEIQRYLKIRQM
jgi:hypothetical protein